MSVFRLRIQPLNCVYVKLFIDPSLYSQSLFSAMLKRMPRDGGHKQLISKVGGLNRLLPKEIRSRQYPTNPDKLV
jgi:hypothetical protein